MNFTKDEKFKLEKQTVIIVFSTPDLLVFETSSGSHMAYSMTDVERMYIDQVLIPMYSSIDVDDKHFQKQYQFLPEFQKKEICQKLAFVQHFLTNKVPKGLAAQNAIISISEKVGVTPPPAESTIRNLVTQYKRANYNALSLLDKRRKMLWVKEAK